MKSNFIHALRHFVRTRGRDTPDGHGRIGYRPSRGEVLLASGLVDYFEAHTEIPEDNFGLNWFIDLPEYLVRAYQEFRTSERFLKLREEYSNEMGGSHQIPDLLDSRGGSYRQLVTSDLARLMPILAVWAGCNDGWLGPKLRSYFDAQITVLDQAWRGFVRKTHPALAERIKGESHRGNSGVFGGVAVRSFAIAGRVMFTFERDGETFSAVCDDSDMLGIRSGTNHCEAPLTVAYQMIVDATENWDLSKFTQNDGINIC